MLLGALLPADRRWHSIHIRGDQELIRSRIAGGRNGSRIGMERRAQQL